MGWINGTYNESDERQAKRKAFWSAFFKYVNSNPDTPNEVIPGELQELDEYSKAWIRQLRRYRLKRHELNPPGVGQDTNPLRWRHFLKNPDAADNTYANDEQGNKANATIQRILGNKHKKRRPLNWLIFALAVIACTAVVVPLFFFTPFIVFSAAAAGALAALTIGYTAFMSHRKKLTLARSIALFVTVGTLALLVNTVLGAESLSLLEKILFIAIGTPLSAHANLLLFRSDIGNIFGAFPKMWQAMRQDGDFKGIKSKPLRIGIRVVNHGILNLSLGAAAIACSYILAGAMATSLVALLHLSGGAAVVYGVAFVVLFAANTPFIYRTFLQMKRRVIEALTGHLYDEKTTQYCPNKKFYHETAKGSGIWIKQDNFKGFTGYLRMIAYYTFDFDEKDTRADRLKKVGIFGLKVLVYAAAIVIALKSQISMVFGITSKVYTFNNAFSFLNVLNQTATWQVLMNTAIAVRIAITTERFFSAMTRLPNVVGNLIGRFKSGKQTKAAANAVVDGQDNNLLATELKDKTRLEHGLDYEGLKRSLVFNSDDTGEWGKEFKPFCQDMMRHLAANEQWINGTNAAEKAACAVDARATQAFYNEGLALVSAVGNGGMNAGLSAQGAHNMQGDCGHQLWQPDHTSLLFDHLDKSMGGAGQMDTVAGGISSAGITLPSMLSEVRNKLHDLFLAPNRDDYDRYEMVEVQADDDAPDGDAPAATTVGTCAHHITRAEHANLFANNNPRQEKISSDEALAMMLLGKGITASTS
jgi:hypothetical protein